jgi:hypothetical protein
MGVRAWVEVLLPCLCKYLNVWIFQGLSANSGIAFLRRPTNSPNSI